MSEKGAHSFSVCSLSRNFFISSVMHAVLPHSLLLQTTWKSFCFHSRMIVNWEVTFTPVIWKI